VPSPLTVDVTTISNSFVTASETSWVTASGDDWVTAAEEFSHIDTPLSIYVKLSPDGVLSIFGPSGRRIVALQYLRMGGVLQNKLRDVRRVLVRQREAGRVYFPKVPDDEFLESFVDMISTLKEGLWLWLGLLDTARPEHLYQDSDEFIDSAQFIFGDTPRFKLGYH